MAKHQDTIITERHGNILVITLNRPEVRNAFNQDSANKMAAALDLLDSDESLRVGILTGSGGCFCAGMDLKAFATKGEWPNVEARGYFGICRRSSDKPLIAAIEGFAVAGGLEVAMSCDILIAAKGAKLGIPEVKRGLAAAAGALFRLPKRIPYHIAMEMALTGDLITTERGAELGLINRLCEPGTALETALALANKISLNAPLGLSVSKQIVQGAMEYTESECWKEQAPLVEMLRYSEDSVEGATAFAENRAPVWKGR